MEQEQKIDIHNSKNRYKKSLQKFSSDNSVSQRNKELMISFLNDCQLGKTLKKRQKKVIKERRLYKYLYHLKFVAQCFPKDFDKMQVLDMENFIRGLESDTLSYVNAKGETENKKYAPQTKRDIKVALRKFYKWLWGNSEKEPEIVAWFDTSVQEKEPDALDEKQIEQLVSFASGIMEKAFTWALFESGARTEEFLNIRLRHVTNKDSYFTFRIEYPKTFKRTTPIHEEPFRAQGVSYLQKWLEVHPKKDELDAQLFPFGYRRLGNFLKELGKRALNKNVTPHLMRDSRATYLARKKVGRYQMCKLMGWSMSSRMPDRYIDRAGVSEEEAIESIRRDDLNKSHEENLELRRKLLDLEKKNQNLENLSVTREKADNIMTKLLSSKEVQKILVEKIKELGLQGEILKA